MKLRRWLLVGVALVFCGCGNDSSSGSVNSDAPAALAGGSVGPAFSTQRRGEENTTNRGPVVLFRDPVNGAVTGWALNSQGEKSAEITLVPRTNLDWELKGIGDFNGDSKPDILWQHRSNGSLAYWAMNGLVVQSAASLPTPSAGWSLQGVADFDGDGQSDILWMNAKSRQTSYWKLQQGRVVGAVSLGIAPADWTLQAAGDIDGDGKAEVLWTKPNGQAGLWNGGQRPFVLPNQWHSATIANIRSDGDSDLLLRKSDGTLACLQLRQGHAFSWQSLGQSPLKPVGVLPSPGNNPDFQPVEFVFERYSTSLPVGANVPLKLYAWDRSGDGYL